MHYFPGEEYTLCGLNTQVKSVTACGTLSLEFTQQKDKVTVKLPSLLQEKLSPVLKFACQAPPAVYRTGGMRVPECRHPRYDPVAPDLLYN